MKVKVDIIRASYVSIIIGYILTLTTIPQGDVIGSAFTSIGLILALYKILFLNHYKIKQYFLLTIVGILFCVCVSNKKLSICYYVYFYSFCNENEYRQIDSY